MNQALSTALILDIVTMPRPVLSMPIRQVVVRSFDGELAILAGHMPLMALLLPCVVQVWPVQPMGTVEMVQRVFISGGVLEVQPQHVTILAEDALSAEEIDIEHARISLADAHQRMRENFLLEDRERARVDAMSAQAQIDLWQWAKESKLTSPV
jgi:F-type H+-transporting ATPase subunit epsilon